MMRLRHWRSRATAFVLLVAYCASMPVSVVFGFSSQQGEFTQGINFYDIVEDNSTCGTGSGSTTANPTSLPTNSAPEARVGQTFVVGFDAGTDKKIIEDLFTKYKLGGIYLTGTSDAAAAGFTKDFYDKLSQEAGVTVNASSDEEGVVHRYAYPAGSLKPAAQMGAQAETIGTKIGQGMKANGLTTDLAPVLDLRDVGNGLDGRSFSSDPNTVITQAGAFTKGLETAGITPVFKHFPGFDSTTSGTTDDVNGRPSIIHMKGSIDQTVAPYKALTAKYSDAGVMMSNMYIDTLDASKPASTSPKVVNYLRSTVGFKGMITTDDLAAGSATQASGGSLANTVADSLNAGVTSPLFQAPNTDSVAHAEQAMSAIINTVKGSVDSTKIDAADTLVAAFKSSHTTTSSSSSCCGGSQLSGDTNKAKIFNYLTSKGLSGAQAAGVLGNMQTESGFEPERLQSVFDHKVPADKVYPTSPADNPSVASTGWGIVQWTPYTKMIDPTTKASQDPNDLGVQLDFLWGQLYGKNGDLGTTSSETFAGQDLKKQTTPEAAANSFGLYYERFAGSFGDANFVQRAAQARSIYVESTKGMSAPPSSGSTATTGATCSSGSSDISGYKNPYRDIKDVMKSRIDGGLDLGGKGPIYAVGAGKVTFLCNAPFTSTENDAACGWYGPRIVYQLSDGPAAQKYIYFAEHCKLRGGLKVGSKVTSDTVLCDMQGVDDVNTESGWSNQNGWDYVQGSDYRANKDPRTGDYTSNSGQNFNDFIKKLGGPTGNPQGGVSHTPLPDFPTWK